MGAMMDASGHAMNGTMKQVCRRGSPGGARAPRRGVMALSMLLLVAGCTTTGPDYRKPVAAEIGVPADYKNLEGWKLAEPADHIERGAWWKIFRDPALDTLAAQVEIANNNVLLAVAQYRQARALADVAHAGLYPSVTGAASATRSGSGGGSTGTASSTSSYRATANLSWELDLWGRLSRTAESRDAALAASAADLAAARLSAQALLVRSYFQLRVADAQKKLLEANIVAFERSLELTRNRYNAGVAARTDVIQAETQLRSTQVQALALDVTRNQLENAIAVLVGRAPAAVRVAGTGLITRVPTIPAPGLPSSLLERRPDIAAAERRMAAANASVGVAMAAFFPSLTLSASGGLANSVLENLITAPSRLWSLGPALAATLFDGGLRRAQTEQAQGQYDAAVASYRQTVLTGLREVEDNLIALRVLEEEARVQDQAVAAARLGVELLTNQYKAGLVSFLNVVTAQTTALNNERSALTILGNRLDALVGLIVATGGGWEARDDAQAVRRP